MSHIHHSGVTQPSWRKPVVIVTAVGLGVGLLIVILVYSGLFGGNPALHGTVTETWYTSAENSGAQGGSCAAQEFKNDPAATYEVQVLDDNVKVGTTKVDWVGGPHGQDCYGNWSMSVPSAQVAYQVTLVAVCNDSVSDIYGTEDIETQSVKSSVAGEPINLSDANQSNNC